MGISTENPQVDDIQRVRDSRAFSFKWDAFIKHPSSGLRDMCRRGGGVKDCKSQRWWFTRWKQCLYDTTKQVHISYTCELTETVTICTRPKRVQTRQNLSTEKAKRKQSLIPNQEAIFSLLFSTGKGKVSFLQWSGAGHIKLTPEQVPSPGVANQQ